MPDVVRGRVRGCGPGSGSEDSHPRSGTHTREGRRLVLRRERRMELSSHPCHISDTSKRETTQQNYPDIKGGRRDSQE